MPVTPALWALGVGPIGSHQLLGNDLFLVISSIISIISIIIISTITIAMSSISAILYLPNIH